MDSEIPNANVSTSLWQGTLCVQAGLNAEHTALHFGAARPTLRGRHSSWINMLHTAQVTSPWQKVVAMRRRRTNDKSISGYKLKLFKDIGKSNDSMTFNVLGFGPESCARTVEHFNDISMTSQLLKCKATFSKNTCPTCPSSQSSLRPHLAAPAIS